MRTLLVAPALALATCLAHASTEDDVKRFEAAQQASRAEHESAGAEARVQAAADQKASLAVLSAQLRSMSITDLCAEFGDAARDLTEEAPLLQRELRRRGLKVDRAAMQGRRLAVGLSQCHLFAAWGRPLTSQRTTSAAGTIEHHVYSDKHAAKVTNGRIVAWTD